MQIIPADAVNRTVIVVNVSPGATEADLREFFSFCGDVERVSLAPDESTSDGSLVALVTFSAKAAANTAELLSNVVVVDRPVSVVPYRANTTTDDSASTAPPGAAVSAVSSVLAGAYVLGQQVVSLVKEADDKLKITKTLKEFDEEHHVSERIRDTTASAVTRTREWNQEHHVSERAAAAATIAKQKACDVASHVDEKYHVSTKTRELSDKAKSTAAVSRSAAWVREVTQSLANVKQETKRKIVAHDTRQQESDAVNTMENSNVEPTTVVEPQPEPDPDPDPAPVPLGPSEDDLD